MPTKLNRAGNQQNYVPAGNGDASGEYGDNATGSNKNFTSKKQEPENPTRKLVLEKNGFDPDNMSEKQKQETFVQLGGEDNWANKAYETDGLGAVRELLINDVLTNHKFTEQETEKVKKIINEADKEVIEHIQALKNVTYRSVKGRAYYRYASNTVNISKDDWISEMRVEGETYFHEYGHAVNHNSKLSGEKLIMDKFRGVKFEVTERQPASSFYVSEKHNKTMQEMLIEEYKKNINGRELKKQIEKEKELLINEKVETSIGKNNVEKFRLEEKEVLQQRDFELEKLENEISSYRTSLYSNKISFEEYKPIQDKIHQKKDDVRLKAKEQINNISKKYGDFLLNFTKATKETDKEIWRKYSSLSDIVDGANKGSFNLGISSHPRGYWGQTSSRRGDEFFAEAFAAKSNNEIEYETLKKYFPNTIDIFEEILKRSK